MYISNEELVNKLSLARSVLKLTDRNISDDLKLNPTTVSLWMLGKNLPVQALRPAIIKYLEKKLRELNCYGN